MGKSFARFFSLAGVMALAFSVGCLDDSSSDGPPPECRTDAECSALDTDADICTVVKCENLRCVPRVLKNSTECQCATDDDCLLVLGATIQDCATTLCTAHKCSTRIEPAGAAPRQKAGDCGKVVCDGTSGAGRKEIDVADVPEDNNPCTLDTCTAAGEPTHGSNVDGTECASGVCFRGGCVACKAQNPTSCGAEGPGEPANDTGAGAAAYEQESKVCGFSSTSDIDWYTFYAKDGDFSHDVLRFDFWSSAPSIEACFYVKCERGGVPEGGCADLKDGPNGSRGCCYTGAPGAVNPNWDIDCTGTTEDSGTIYMSVRTVGGTDCERYLMTGGY